MERLWDTTEFTLQHTHISVISLPPCVFLRNSCVRVPCLYPYPCFLDDKGLFNKINIEVICFRCIRQPGTMQKVMCKRETLWIFIMSEKKEKCWYLMLWFLRRHTIGLYWINYVATRKERFVLKGSPSKDIGTVLNIGRYTGILAEIPVFYPKWYVKYKNLPDIVLDRYWPIYRHVVDISPDIWDEISDISADIVTYLDNCYFFAWEIVLFYSMFIVIFQWCFYMTFG